MTAAPVVRASAFGLTAMLLVVVLLTLPTGLSAEAAVTVIDPGTDPAICRVDLGTSGEIFDDAFYLSMNGDDDKVELNDIRLTTVGAKGPGTLVLAGDTTEIVGPTGVDCQAYTVAWFNVHPDSRFGPGSLGNDTMYIGYNKAASPVVSVATATGDWWVRLVAYGSGAARREAGTLVKSGDSDITAFQDGGSVLTDAEFAYWDKDATTTWTSGDLAYITSRGVITGDFLPLYSVRVVPGTKAFGSYARLGDQDITLPLVDPATDATLCRVDLNTPNAANDDAYYLNVNADGNTIQNGDVRLTAYGDKPAGTIVSGGSATELATSGVDCRAYTVAYFDSNSNGIYDKDDAVLLGYDATTTPLVSGTTHGGDWWIRITPSKTYAAGSILNAGDSDASAGAVLTGAEFGYYDLDVSATTTQGDFVYITSAAIATGNRAPTLSVRLVNPTYAYGTKVAEGDNDGPFTTVTPTPTTSTSLTSVVTTTSTSTTSTTATTTAEPAPISSLPPKTRVPGFEVAAVVFALGALVLVRRRA